MAQIWHCSAHFFPLQVGEIGFSGIGGQVSLCGLAPLLNILVSNTMFWVWDHFQKHLIQINLEVRNDFTSWSPPWPPTAPPTCSWPSGRSKTSENGSKWFPIPQNIGFDTMYLACSEADLLPKLEFHFLKSSLPPTAHPLCSWPSGQSEVAKNGPKWFSITQNMGFDTMLMLACSEAELLPKLEFLFLISSWTSYSPFTQFLAFRSICGF